MSTEQLIQTVFSNNFELKKKQSMVFGSLANTSFEGDIKNGGETVKIIEESEIAIIDSLGLDGGPVVYNALTPTAQEMRIDEDPYISIRISEREEEQLQSKDAKQVLKKAFDRGYYQLEKHVEDNMAGLYTDAGIVISGTATITKANAYEYMNRMETLFLRADLGAVENLWAAVLPPEYVGMLELDTANVNTETGMKIRQNGWMGKCGRFNVYVSSSVKADGSSLYHPMFLVKGQSLALAMQTAPKVKETTRPNYFEKAFAVRETYGKKGYRPDKIGTFACNFSYS
jgi:hypothetical protein